MTIVGGVDFFAALPFGVGIESVGTFAARGGGGGRTKFGTAVSLESGGGGGTTKSAVPVCRVGRRGGEPPLAGDGPRGGVGVWNGLRL